ncbi:uncharacterized protein EDB93DRAFT_1243056 [Suillus bovinus]|uniref:uncharacterized protein n=1 Tax=Suillus bovinus TaxID=48563 RepID=UPI001B8639D1|nr:uncharacterized protein EDB93DRAFT_1243056 [Suillus bovinus]KAG2132128.1 hypothetical protein EDB93DRAFT_1243056 [Suillus bovinus]
MPEITCPTCNKKLTSITGYSQHLAKTTNPACRTLYLSLQQFAPNPPDDGDIGAPDPCHALHFEGNFFGTYAEDELTWPESDDEGDIGEVPMDKDDSDGDIDDNDEWEPPVVSTAFSKLVSIEGVSLGFCRPKFKHDQVVIANKVFDVYYCDIIECIKALLNDPNFAEFLVFAPECHYADEDKTVCLHHEMNTGKWWWNSQKHLDCECPSATIIPVIIPSDKTQVTMSHNKTAYPVYMTIGNILKEIRRKPSRQAHILLVYLPTTRLEHVTNKAAHRRVLANLYHTCVEHVLAPLTAAGITHPLFACFAGDYPEQVLATGVKTTECPKCDVPSDELSLATGIANWQLCTCADAGIKPIVHPFWEELPFINIFESITPNVLHQLYQGLIKHLLTWLSDVCGSTEIDAQYFLYFAQYPCHSSETLVLLDKALNLFHKNKDIFIDLSIQNLFNLPKLHSMAHYTHIIRMYGTTDNYNTEYTEHLHIDLTTDAYRSMNHKSEFAQMTTWLERREKILHHDKYIYACPHHQPHPPDMSFCHIQMMMKCPTIKAVTLDKVTNTYGATHFNKSLTHYVVKATLPANTSIMARQLEDQAADIHIPFQTGLVFHKVKWLSTDVHGHGDPPVTVNSVHACPGCPGTFTSHNVAPRFDTVSWGPLFPPAPLDS